MRGAETQTEKNELTKLKQGDRQKGQKANKQVNAKFTYNKKFILTKLIL